MITYMTTIVTDTSTVRESQMSRWGPLSRWHSGTNTWTGCSPCTVFYWRLVQGRTRDDAMRIRGARTIRTKGGFLVTENCAALCVSTPSRTFGYDCEHANDESQSGS